jgi:hypothetical protein
MRRVRVALVAVLAACGGGSSSSVDAPVTGDATHDATVMHVDDGTPSRQTCTNNLGNALPNNSFGRMDGFLVAIVAPGNGGCNADTDHLHLQVKMNNMIYDVAVDIGGQGVDDVHSTTRDVAMPGGAWSEGFHVGIPTDYIAIAELHAADLPLETTRQALTAEITSELSTVNHISIFATPYGADGAHLVHRNGQGHDGLIATQPLSSPPHLRFLSFSDQTF